MVSTDMCITRFYSSNEKQYYKTLFGDMQELGTVWVTRTVLWRYIRDNEFENTINH